MTSLKLQALQSYTVTRRVAHPIPVALYHCNVLTLVTFRISDPLLPSRDPRNRELPLHLQRFDPEVRLVRHCTTEGLKVSFGHRASDARRQSIEDVG